MSRDTTLKAWLLFLLGVVILSAPVAAETDGGTIIHDITITEESGYTILQVGFTLPMRYVRHFPYPWGEELRIQMAALSTGPADDELIFRREVVHDLGADAAPLLEIVYEGRIIGGPYLTVRFQQPMEYHVGQGADVNSLVIVFFKQEASKGGLAAAGPVPAGNKP